MSGPKKSYTYLIKALGLILSQFASVSCLASAWPSFRPPSEAQGGGCHWQWEFLGTHPLTPLYPETHANYWVFAWDREPTQADIDLKIHAAVPETRFFSFTLYDGATGAVIDSLTDERLFAQQAPTADSKHYTLSVRTDSPTEPGRFDPPQLRVPTDLRHPVLMLRYYVEDPAQSYGGKKLPTITSLKRGTDLLTRCPKPAPFRLPSDTLATARKFRQLSRSIKAESIEFYRINAQGLYPNPANAYLSTRLFFDDYGDLAIITYKSLPNIAIGWKKTIRYQSVCMGSYLSTLTPSNGCLMDREYVQESDGTLKFVISSDPGILQHAKNLGLNTLETGTKFPMVLIRQLLTQADLHYSYSKVPNFDPDREHAIQAARFILGEYGPRGYYCSRERFLILGEGCQELP